MTERKLQQDAGKRVIRDFRRGIEQLPLQLLSPFPESSAITLHPDASFWMVTLI